MNLENKANAIEGEYGGFMGISPVSAPDAGAETGGYFSRPPSRALKARFLRKERPAMKALRGPDPRNAFGFGPLRIPGFLLLRRRDINGGGPDLPLL